MIILEKVHNFVFSNIKNILLFEINEKKCAIQIFIMHDNFNIGTWEENILFFRITDKNV